MQKTRAFQIATGALAAGVLGFLLTRPAAGGPTVGALAPEFHLADLTGRTATLAEYRGKVVLLDFWATWCPSCEAELPNLKAVHSRYPEGDFAVLAASVDEAGPEVVARYASEKSLPYRVLFADTLTSKAYRIADLPTKFLIGRDGVIARKYFGDVAPLELEKDIKTQLDRRPS